MPPNKCSSNVNRICRTIIMVWLWTWCHVITSITIRSLIINALDVVSFDQTTFNNKWILSSWKFQFCEHFFTWVKFSQIININAMNTRRYIDKKTKAWEMWLLTIPVNGWSILLDWFLTKSTFIFLRKKVKKC
jgi:hypothetical protein